MHYYYDYPMMRQDYGIWDYIVPVVMLLIIATVIIVAIRMLRGSHFGRHHAHRDPLDIAKERYARGELTKEQYDTLRKDLTV